MAQKKMIRAEGGDFVRPALGASFTTWDEIEEDAVQWGVVVEVERVEAIYGYSYPTMLTVRQDDGGEPYRAEYLSEYTPRGAALRFGLNSYYDCFDAEDVPVKKRERNKR
jgi:hypothetical protein